MLKEGIYESIVSAAISKKLEELPIAQFYIEQGPVDKAEASKILSTYLADLIHLAMVEYGRAEEGLQKQITFCNDLIQFIDRQLDLDISDSLVSLEGQILTAVLSKIAKTDKQLREEVQRKLPQTGLSISNLFTGSNADISIDSEIERDILSADKIYWIVAFIRWSGLRLFEKALREFTEREGASLQIITTTYMGATESKSLEFLSSLPNTELKISYQTEIERLHAKSYIFERNSGFDTAYIGSSNLSKSALTKGLEWNLRVTSKENPHIIQKAQATFEYYWNSIDFEDFKVGGIDRFKKALRLERDKGSKTIDFDNYFQIDLHPFQKEILDVLTTERKIHNRYKNLIVSATGTGKTIISAFDYKGFFNQNKEKANLLFVAHREEILKQSRNRFRAILGNHHRDFGQLWVGNHEPNDGDLKHLFISIQTLNSQKQLIQERLSADYYDFIIIDEAHHSQADTYRIVFDYFRPKILIGLTATPERMDGRSLLPDFCDKIAAEIRLPDALSLKLLCPFHYFCISDESVDLRAVKWTAGKYDVSELTQALSTINRVKLITDAINHYLTDPFAARALCFCSSKDHAIFMSEALTKAGFRADYIVSGLTTAQKRDALRQNLKAGEVNFLCVVDIFNEGIDIPEIDTVIFLRPTESLTVFLQQLGRGLRISENKPELTVLDFVNQAHVQYNFAEKFRAITGKTNQPIEKEIEKGFTHLPAGCNIVMEKQAKAYILENIKNAIFNLRKLRKEVAAFRHNSHRELTLTNFLNFHQLDIRTVYSKQHWYGLQKEVGVMRFEEHGHYKQIAAGLRRLVHVNSVDYLHFIEMLFQCNFSFAPKTEEEEKFALMFYYDIWQKGIGQYHFKSIEQGIETLAQYPEFVEELKEILFYLKSALKHSTGQLEFDFANILELHALYSRDQILCAMGKSTVERPFPSQEGVVQVPELNAEVLLVTLNKSDKDFSPSTQYDDYAISETIFHWQSQNRTTPESKVGISYIQQDQTGKILLLFVREEKKDQYGFTSPYYFLGPVSYISHKGSRPMSINWELKEPIPAYLWKAAAKMAV